MTQPEPRPSPPARPPRPPLLVARRVLFWLYAAALVTATHWPRLEIDSTLVRRPDIIIHIGAFGLFTGLLLLSGYLGPMLRPRTAVRAFLVGVIFAAVDEVTQAVPILQRTAAWDDFAANVGGIAAACIAVPLLGRLLPPWLRAFLNAEPAPSRSSQ